MFLQVQVSERGEGKSAKASSRPLVRSPGALTYPARHAPAFGGNKVPFCMHSTAILLYLCYVLFLVLTLLIRMHAMGKLVDV